MEKYANKQQRSNKRQKIKFCMKKDFVPYCLERDIGLFFTLVPKVSYLLASQLWGLLLNYDWLFH